MTLCRRRIAKAVPLALTLTLATGLPALSQEEAGGTRFTFGFSQGITAKGRNLFVPGGGSPSVSAKTGLNFGLISETRSQRFSLSSAGFIAFGPGGTTVSDPNLSVSYQNEAANARYEVGAGYREKEVSTLNFITPEDDVDGGATIRTTGTGLQRQISTRAVLALGLQGRVGTEFRFGQTQTQYSGTTDPTLVGSRKSNLGVSLRMHLNEASELVASASGNWNQIEGSALTSFGQSYGLSYVLQRPDGRYTVTAGATTTSAGLRRSVTGSRAIDLPGGGLTFRFGATDLRTGGNDVIGSLEWKQDLPRGNFRIAAHRAIEDASLGDEEKVTRLTAAMSQTLTDRVSLDLSLGFQDSLLIAAGTTARSTNLSASVGYALTADWKMNFGANHKVLQDSALVTTQSSEFFVNISRSFEFRP